MMPTSVAEGDPSGLLTLEEVLTRLEQLGQRGNIVRTGRYSSGHRRGKSGRVTEEGSVESDDVSWYFHPANGDPPTPVEDFEWVSISSQESPHASVSAEKGMTSKSHRRERETAAAGVVGDVLPSAVGAVAPSAPGVEATALPVGLATPVQTVDAAASMAAPGVADGSTSAPDAPEPDWLDGLASRFTDVVDARSKLFSFWR
jgi:hypothetical protein